MTWQTIDTAPKDSTTKIDVWAISTGRPEGFRVTDAHRQYDGGRYPDVWIDRDGYFINTSSYYDDDWDACSQLGNIPHPEAKSWTKVTHWMPRPEGPQN
jgi:hypothetical protein